MIMNLYDRLHDKVLTKYAKDPMTECYSPDCVFKYQEEIYDATVIIPCYNVEHYVAECLDSMLNQNTSYNVEIITIDDGSTDSTAEILRQYSTRMTNFRIISQCNKGLSGARNTGIREARGKYLIFIDSDDYVTSDYIDCLLKKAFSKDADIVATGYYTFNNDYKIIKNIMIKDENDTSLLNGCAWGKAIKRKFFEHLVFPENYWYEDSIIAHLVVPRANSIYMVSKCQYAYRSNPTGITKTSVNSLRAIESFYITDLMLRSYVHFYPEDVTNTYEFINLLIEQFYLNEKRVIKLNSEIKRTIFMWQSKYVQISPPIMDLKLDFSKKLYVIGLLKNNYQIAQISLRLDILNKIIRRIKNK